MIQNSQKYPTEWDLSKKFYTSIDDPKINQDTLKAE
jgi:hypothetical protein